MRVIARVLRNVLGTPKKSYRDCYKNGITSIAGINAVIATDIIILRYDITITKIACLSIHSNYDFILRINIAPTK